MCVEEIRGTPKEAEVNAIEVNNVVTMYQSQIDLQGIVDLDQDLNQKMEYIQNCREHIQTDKKQVIESIEAVFDQLQEELDDRRQQVLSDVKLEYKKQFGDIDDILKGILAIGKRCKDIFPGKKPGQALDYIKSLERILDFQSDMVAVN